MITKLIKLANEFDKKGETEKADRLDAFVIKWAQEDREPTPEELLAEEKWLEEEGIDPYSLTEEDALEGLEGEDRAAAEYYMEGKDPEDIREMLQELKDQQGRDVEREMDQQKILDQLSQVLMRGQSDVSPEALPFQMPITPEASLMNDLVKLSEMLDARGMYKHADFFDKMLTKLAEDPDDFFGDDDDDLEGSDAFWNLREQVRDWEDEIGEPTTEELEMFESSFEGTGENQLYRLLGFAQRVAEGMYMNLESAQEDAKMILKGYDLAEGVPGLPPEPEPPAPKPPGSHLRLVE